MPPHKCSLENFSTRKNNFDKGAKTPGSGERNETAPRAHFLHRDPRGPFGVGAGRGDGGTGGGGGARGRRGRGGRRTPTGAGPRDSPPAARALKGQSLPVADLRGAHLTPTGVNGPNFQRAPTPRLNLARSHIFQPGSAPPPHSCVPRPLLPLSHL